MDRNGLRMLCGRTPGPPITVSGDTRVDCPTFAVKRGVNFQTGSVISDGDVAITGNGEMSINTASGGAGTSATDPAVVYLRDGELSRLEDPIYMWPTPSCTCRRPPR